MIPTIQEEISEALKVIEKPDLTLEELFRAIPDSFCVKDKAYCLRVEPIKGSLTFVDYINIDKPEEEPYIHSEHPDFNEALIVMIKLLGEKVTDEWKDY